MASVSREKVFETIRAQLQEHKIVTFKWLSRILKIHNTLAKEYLGEWIEKNPEDQYIISYLVFGRKDNGELLLTLTKGTIDDHFGSRDITIAQKDVYSIQLPDTSFVPSLVYDIDKSTYELQQMSLSSINYHTEIIRKSTTTDRASASLNGTSHSQNDVRRISPRKKNNDLMKKNGVRETSPQKNGHTINKLDNSSPKNDNSEIESRTISNSQSTQDVNKSKQSCLMKKPKTNKSVVASRSITNFFGKSSTAKDKSNELKEPETENLNELEKNSDTEISVEGAVYSSVEKVDEKKIEKEPAIKPQEESKENRKSSKKNSTKKTKKKGKQMKRILILDSESDEESNNSDTSSINDEAPETEPEPVDIKESEPEPPVLALNGKKRKRKVIVEEGKDEDGYMVTTRKAVYESCDSEDEPEECPNKDKLVESNNIEFGPPDKKLKTELLTKKKQSSILSFLQKPKKSM